MRDSLVVKPMTSTLGAEIDEVDLTQPITAEMAKRLRQALLDYLVIFFRGQDLTTAQHQAVARVFGPLITVAHVSGKPWPGYSDVFLLEERKVPQGTLAGSDVWHSDFTWEQSPALGISLHAQTVPPVGGDTCFASMYAAYDALSPSMQTLLDGLTAVNTNRLFQMRTARADADFGPPLDAVHPVVRVHPETGRKALFVNAAFTCRIVELAQIESDAVLHFLFEHVKEPTFQCRFRWEPHSLAIWDNRCSQHYASADYSDARKMRRLIIGSSDRPSGPARREM
jgi:taurine dioxygenase